MAPRAKPIRTRAAGIVLRDGMLLVMFRRRDGREYCTFPGGMIEKDESPEEAVVREIKEETTIEATVERLCYELRQAEGSPYRNMQEYFFLCAYDNGEPALAADSIERRINDLDRNYFEPKWMKISDLQKDIPLFPTEVAEQFFYDVEHGFPETPVMVEGNTIGG